jgi:hypothetical protein
MLMTRAGVTGSLGLKNSSRSYEGRLTALSAVERGSAQAMRLSGVRR